MCSASVIDKDISDWSFDDHAIGKPTYLIIKLDLIKTECKKPDYFKFQVPENSLLAQSSKPFLELWENISPLSLVLFKHIPILLIAMSWYIFGSIQNRLSWWIACWMHGRVKPARHVKIICNDLKCQSSEKSHPFFFQK